MTKPKTATTPNVEQKVAKKPLAAVSKVVHNKYVAAHDVVSGKDTLALLMDLPSYGRADKGLHNTVSQRIYQSLINTKFVGSSANMALIVFMRAMLQNYNNRNKRVYTSDVYIAKDGTTVLVVDSVSKNLPGKQSSAEQLIVILKKDKVTYVTLSSHMVSQDVHGQMALVEAAISLETFLGQTVLEQTGKRITSYEKKDVLNLSIQIV